MPGYAAGNAANAYQGPPGTIAQAGTATQAFLKSPLNLQMWEFIALAFVIFILARHWGKFVNAIT